MAPTVPQTVPEFFAMRRGSFRCYYCGASCGPEYLASQWVAKSFTSRDTIFGGEFVCTGCTIALNESAEVSLPDNTRREQQKMRCYSWVLTEGKHVAATKSHFDFLRSTCLAPPPPPYAIVLSDSGQKHLLYRGVVCHSQDRAVVTLEGERIDYTTHDLHDRLEVCKQIVAATGKPALKESLSPATGMRVAIHCGNDAAVSFWSTVQHEPLSRLAAWLCPNKEECLRDYPAAAS